MGYLHNRGDYGAYRGDPGILGTLGKIAGGVVGALVPGGSVVTSTIRALAQPAQRRMPAAPAMPAMPAIQAPPRQPPKRETMERQLKGYSKRRRMNVGNAKALRRAIRRTDGFVKLAKRALKGTGYTVTRRGSSKRGPRTIVETGPGSVHTR